MDSLNTPPNIFSPQSLSSSEDFNFLNILSDADNSNFDFSDSPYDSKNIQCTYVNENELSSKFSNNRDVTVCSINIQSLPAKFSELCQFINVLNLNNSSPDILCLQELWQFPDSVSFVLPGYHPLIYKLRRNNVQGGGVGIYVKSHFKFNLLIENSIFVDRIFESLTIELYLNSKQKIIISSIYRPGSKHPLFNAAEQFVQFSEIFSNFCDSLTALNSKLYIMGDLNLDVLKYSTCPNVTSYVDLLFSYGLLQIITKPTRCTSHSATLIDHIITNNSETSLESYIITTFLSDHFPVFHCIKTVLKNPPPLFPILEIIRNVICLLSMHPYLI